METIGRKRFSDDAVRLFALAGERRATGFVLGLPVNMDGTEGPRAQATRAFARNLAKLTELPIALWDERLSTAAVERMLIEGDTSRARRAELIDKLAAELVDDMIAAGNCDAVQRLTMPMPLRVIAAILGVP